MQIHPNLKRLTRRTLLGLLGICIALVTAEAGLRIFAPQKTLNDVQSVSFRCFQEGEHRWIKMKANATCILRSVYDPFPPVEVQTNSHGMRSPQIDIQKPPNTKRVLFIGDSFTMGWGVEASKAFPQQTEALLAQRNLPFAVQTINAGFTAAGPSGYWLSLKLDGLQFDPDVVVIGFFLGNDILSRKDVEWVRVDAQGLPDVVRSRSNYVDATGQLRLRALPPAYHIPYLRNTHTFILLMNALYPGATIPNQDDLVKDTICVFNRECHAFDQAKSEVKMLFSAMHTLLAKQNKRLVIAIIPTNFQVHFDVEYKRRYNLPLLPSERRFLNDEFIEYFRANGIDYVDLLPPLLEHAGQNRLYYEMDDHWNETGHTIAAQAIAEKLLTIWQ